MIEILNNSDLKENRTVSAIMTNIVLAAVSQFFNGFGVYLTIQADIGAGPWDVFIATLVGWILGGPVGIGTLICAFATGPIMQMAFSSVKFDATHVHHQHLAYSMKVFMDNKPA